VAVAAASRMGVRLFMRVLRVPDSGNTNRKLSYS
jgi:hypothetical protein